MWRQGGTGHLNFSWATVSMGQMWICGPLGASWENSATASLSSRVTQRWTSFIWFKRCSASSPRINRNHSKSTPGLMASNFQTLQNLRLLKKDIWAACLRKHFLWWWVCCRWTRVTAWLASRPCSTPGSTTFETMRKTHSCWAWLRPFNDQSTPLSPGLPHTVRNSINQPTTTNWCSSTPRNKMGLWVIQRKRSVWFRSNPSRASHPDL